jgi:hypothetical protein
LTLNTRFVGQLRKSSYEIADLQQTAQIISGFRSSFLPRWPKAGQCDGNLGESNDYSDLLINTELPDYLFTLNQIKPAILAIRLIH